MKKLFNNKWLQFIIATSLVIIIYKLFNNIADIKHFLKYLFDIFFPVIIGGIIAVFVYKPVFKLKKTYEKINLFKKKSLVLSIFTVYTLIISFFIIAINFVVPPIYKNIEDLAKNLPGYYNLIYDFVIDHNIQNFITLDTLKNIIPRVLNFDNLSKYIGIISDIANSFITLFISVVLSIYILLEKEAIFNFLRLVKNKFFNNNGMNIFVTYVKKSVNLFNSYFLGLFVDAIFMGIFSSIIFSFFKLPYAAVLGFIVAVGNLIPFFGPIISTAIVFIISAFSLGIVDSAWILIIQIIIAQLDANLLQPKILSQSTGISPLLVLISVTVFGSLGGTFGMILGVPFCALVKMLVLDYVDDGVINGENPSNSINDKNK